MDGVGIGNRPFIQLTANRSEAFLRLRKTTAKENNAVKLIHSKAVLAGPAETTPYG